MGRGALTLFPVCAATGAQGGAAAQAFGLGAVPPAGGTAGALRAPAAPPTRLPASAPAFFRITLPPRPLRSPQQAAGIRAAGQAAPAGRLSAAAPPGLRPSPPTLRPSPPTLRPSPPGLRPSPPGLRPSPPGLRPSPPTLRPSPPTLRPSPPTRAQPPPHPANSPKISHETIPTKIQILYKSVPQSPPFVNFP